MLVKTTSIAPYGADIVEVTIETYVTSRGFPSFDIVGLASKEVSESRQRVSTAIKNSGIDFPPKKIVINLAPASIPKVGAFLDLPIAVSLLCALFEVPSIPDSLFFGELSLDGSVRVTPRAFLAGLKAKELKLSNLFVPQSSVASLSAFKDLRIFPISSLNQILALLQQAQKLKSFSFLEDYSNYLNSQDNAVVSDSQEVLASVAIIGQENAKKAIQISAAGKHNLILVGPPGGGKTLLASSYKFLLPELSHEASIEVTKFHMLAKNGSAGMLFKYPPFRQPHHTISHSGMIGGGVVPKPGEITLAHKGILFMDEFTEFKSTVLETLRQPMESGQISINRNLGVFTFPCDFTLVAACNPCPCGYANSPDHSCTCSFGKLQNYRQKLSGPIMDRFDLFVWVSAVEKVQLHRFHLGSGIEPWDLSSLKNKILVAQNLQKSRFSKENFVSNSKIPVESLQKYCVLDKDASEFFIKAADNLNISARVYTKLLKVSRTIADLEGHINIEVSDIAQALQFRNTL